MHIWKLATSIIASFVYAPFVYVYFHICAYIDDTYTNVTDDAYTDVTYDAYTDVTDDAYTDVTDDAYTDYAYIKVGHFHNGVFCICTLLYMGIYG
jgi:hypothetical protein